MIFVQAETLYLTQMIDFMQTYIENVDSSHNDIGQVRFATDIVNGYSV